MTETEQKIFDNFARRLARDEEILRALSAAVSACYERLDVLTKLCEQATGGASDRSKVLN